MSEDPDPEVERLLRERAVWVQVPEDLEERILAEIALPPVAER